MVVATISVQFKELPQFSSGPPPPVPPGTQLHAPESVQDLHTVQLNCSRNMEGGAHGGGSTNFTGTPLKQNDAGEAAISMQNDEDPSYGCRIVEEPPSDDYGL